MTQKTLGCVVAYHPDDQFMTRVSLIAKQVDELLVVDNSESDDLNLTETTSVVVARNRNKGGIAGALNRALDHGRIGEFTHVALFDHDSVITENMIPTLISNLEAGFGTVIGPLYRNSATNHPGRFVVDELGKPKSRWISENLGVVKAYFVITSGTVIALGRLNPAIRYDESLLVDMVDVEFCLRLRHDGGTVLLDTTQMMLHGIGNRPDGASRFAPPQYSAWRFSSVIRNRITIWRRWGGTYTRFVIQDVMVAILDFCRNVVLLKDRATYLRSVMLGIKQGLRQR